MQSISYRPARQDESRIVGSLFRAAADGVADYIWSSLQESGEDLLDVAERRFSRTGTAFSYENAIIADDNGKAVGLALGFPMHVDPIAEPCDDPVLAPFAELELDNSYYLAGLAVSEDCRNSGIGSRLLAEAEKAAFAQGYNQISLIVFDENTGGRRLYERLGFREIDRKAIVPHPMIHVTGDAILMAKKLAGTLAA